MELDNISSQIIDDFVETSHIAKHFLQFTEAVESRGIANNSFKLGQGTIAALANKVNLL